SVLCAFAVRRRGRAAARLLFRPRLDRAVVLEVAAKALRAHLRQRRRQRRLAVTHVPDRPHVHVRLRAFEFTLGHDLDLADSLVLMTPLWTVQPWTVAG